MIDFVEDFLKEATLQLSEMKGLQNIAEQETLREETRDDLYAFFDFVRSVAPFAGFMRSYRLADAAVREIRAYRDQKQISDPFPSVLKKFLRIKDILASADPLKKEASESDDDLLPDVSQNFDADELPGLLRELEKIKAESLEEQKKYDALEKEFHGVSQSLSREKEIKGQVLKEKRELEKQHFEFNSRLIRLQKSLGAEAEKVRRMEKKLEQQKDYGIFVRNELRAAGWPPDTEKIQRELAILARQNETKTATNSLMALKELIGQIRARSFTRIPRFFRNMVQKTSRKYQKPCEINIDCDVSGGVDKETLAVLKQILTQLTDNVFRYAVPQETEKLRLSFTARENNMFLHCSFSDNGAFFDFDKLYQTVQSEGFIQEKAAVQKTELLAYLFHNVVKIEGKARGLTDVAQLLEKAGGQVSVDFNKGLQIDFSIPKHFLFDRVLLFRLSDQIFALPLNAVAETIFFDDESNPENSSFFYRKGTSLPVLKLDESEQNGFGIIVQAGVFSFLLPVQQILDAEHMVSFSEEEENQKCSYLIPCTVLESGREPLWLNIAELLKQVVLPLPRKVVSLPENAGSNAGGDEVVSYLVFRSDPSFFGAVRVNAVLKVEDFSLSPNNSARKKYLETEGRHLPLKDSCSHEGFPYAQAILIFEKFALAIQEVVDIVDVPAGDDNTDSIVYRGRKVKVFPTTL
ncbi:MAG: hypothetical protein J5787_06795 [Alphaproteobacteria bacterium]|nr:hypothetical protein [Alphaproteobacteria bacterium]